MAYKFEMLLSALTDHGRPSPAGTGRTAGSDDPWPVKATNALSGPPSPRKMGRGTSSLCSPETSFVAADQSRSAACQLVKTAAPSIQGDQGCKLALLVVFNQQALFPEPQRRLRKSGEEHPTRLGRGHLIRQAPSLFDHGFRFFSLKVDGHVCIHRVTRSPRRCPANLGDQSRRDLFGASAGGIASLVAGVRSSAASYLGAPTLRPCEGTAKAARGRVLRSC